MIRRAKISEIPDIVTICKACALYMISNGIYQWNDALSRTSIAITDTNTQTLRATDEYNLINNQAYIGIAWLDEGEYAIIGQRTGESYTVGDNVDVILSRVSLVKKQIDLELVD